MVTNTGPWWVCHGICPPGCTVTLFVTMCDRSAVLITSVLCPSTLRRTCIDASSVKAARGVNTSVTTGGGGVGSAYAMPPDNRTAVAAIPVRTTPFLNGFHISVLRSIEISFVSLMWRTKKRLFKTGHHEPPVEFSPG